MKRDDHVLIVGAGLVGSLLAVLLIKRGLRVTVVEKREDPRVNVRDSGRSINLALSHRGIRTLKLAGVFSRIEPDLIPMKGRMMHDEEGNLTFQPYGREGQHINSVSRNQLNRVLIEEAEELGVKFMFGMFCQDVDLDAPKAYFVRKDESHEIAPDVIIGADGAFSAVRSRFQKTDRFNYSQYYIEHGYKELTIPPKNGEFALEPNYLHIWPRGKYMLIALPNPDKSFTCTLFFPYEGLVSFDSVNTADEMEAFFSNAFW